MHGFDADAYIEAVRCYRKDWVQLDDVLRTVCNDCPGHADRAAVNTKLYLIGRSYQTGIERQILTTGGQAGSLSKLAAYLVSHHAEVDGILELLSGLDEPLDAGKLARLISAHGQLTRLVAGITRGGNTPRSFVSKYLHFHCALVPIYDGVAVSRLTQLVRWGRSLQAFPCSDAADPGYWQYALRFLRLYEDVDSRGLPITVKLIDAYLLFQPDGDGGGFMG